ncbi:MAG TPA: hypothetical protein VFL91_07725 [Thermomicrobiales bacterium]|nr:hypothetical protein [Thermomicrobiales bacterium]
MDDATRQPHTPLVGRRAVRLVMAMPGPSPRAAGGASIVCPPAGARPS